MKTLLFFVIMALASLVYAANPTPSKIELTPTEKAYLEEKKDITMCVDPDWEPFEIIDGEGRHVGIAADLIALVSERLKTPIRLVRTATWQETLEKSKSGQCDILSFVNQTPEREKWLVFTQPLLIDPNILITREEHPFVGDLRALDGERMALPDGTAMLERFRKDFPNLHYIPVVSEADAIEMVSDRRAELTVRSLIVAAYTIKKEGLFNLKISGQPAGYENRLRIGVLKDRPILRDILDKGIVTITPIEREAIINRHTGLVVNEGIDQQTILKYLAFILIIALFFMWRYFELKRYNKKLQELSITDKLTGLYNRLKIDEKLEEEHNRVIRYENYQCSIMMIDIDFFKSINDTYGHQKGDEILKKLSDLMNSTFRNTDSIGRWGGEEFIIILPSTSTQEAHMSAEKLRIKVEENLFTDIHPVTISIGLGTFLAHETVDELLGRIDAALYDAKNKGRNCVVLA
jgi:diguanylate cyclase (GGDEF)-like protein